MNAVAGVAMIVALDAAAPPAASPPAPVNERIARAAGEWRRLGPRALPRLVRAYCAEDDGPLREAAEQELRGRGLPAFDALLRHRDRACEGGDLAAEILCHAQPLDDGALRSSLSRVVGPMTSPKVEQTAVDLESMFGLPIIALKDRFLVRDCPNSEQLSRAMLDVLLTPEHLARARPDVRSSIALTLPALFARQPGRRAAYFPLLAKWLEADDGSSADVVDALGAMGPDAAPAVPALHAYLVRGLGTAPGARKDPRRFRAAMLLSLPKAATAAAAIGNAARPMLGPLRDGLEVAISRICVRGRSDEAGVVLEAMAKLDASTWKLVGAKAEEAWRKAGNCTAVPLAVGDAGVRGRDRLMDGVAAFGAAAASFQAVLRPLLTDAGASLDTRGRAARTLRRIGARLQGRDVALAAVLEARLTRRATPPLQRQARTPVPPEAVGAQSALDAIADCMADANVLQTKPQAPADLAAFSYDENSAFRECVDARLCGPGADVLGDTLSTCCAFAYQRGEPVFCRARP